MYKFKNEKKKEINKTHQEIADIVGVSRVYVNYILNNTKNCTKPIAYCITKAINKEADIKDYFNEVKE